jgi:hypothetical protein
MNTTDKARRLAAAALLTGAAGFGAFAIAGCESDAENAVEDAGEAVDEAADDAADAIDDAIDTP